MEQLVAAKIPYSEFRGMRLSKLMLGTAQLGMSGYGVANRETHVDDRALLDRCRLHGVNCYDTALEYGDAELKLGRYFEERGERPFLVSKLKTPLDLSSEAALEAEVRQKVETILDRLRLNRLPALMIHEPQVLSVYGDRLTGIVERLRREGLIERAGLSLGARPDVQYAECRTWLAHDIYELIQLPMNVWDRRVIACGALRQFREQEKLIVVRSVFLQGLFFHDGESLPAVLRETAPQALARLRAFAEEEALSVAQLALSYIRDLEGVHTLVIGAETPDQIDDNVRLLQGPALSERTRDRVERAFRDMPEALITPLLWK